MLSFLTRSVALRFAGCLEQGRDRPPILGRQHAEDQPAKTCEDARVLESRPEMFDQLQQSVIKSVFFSADRLRPPFALPQRV